MTPALVDRINRELAHRRGEGVRILSEHALGGGSINDAYRLETSAGRYFLKSNSADRFPSMFEAEAAGLKLLHEADALRVPDVVAFGEQDGVTYLLLEWVEAAQQRSSFWQDFGQALARLHQRTSDHFGLDRDNYIGSLKQANTQHAKWEEFFIHCRLEPQVKMARDTRRIGMGEVLRCERLYGRLASLFPTEPPALLHGDLWSGNYLTGPTGGPVIIDPAVYFGHREMDIAMTRLFGGFEPGFYSAYNDERALEQGWEERIDLCNLYPLLVHLNLFGSGYLVQVQQILRRFT